MKSGIAYATLVTAGAATLSQIAADFAQRYGKARKGASSGSTEAHRRSREYIERSKAK